MLVQDFNRHKELKFLQLTISSPNLFHKIIQIVAGVLNTSRHVVCWLYLRRILVYGASFHGQVRSRPTKQDIQDSWNTQ